MAWASPIPYTGAKLPLKCNLKCKIILLKRNLHLFRLNGARVHFTEPKLNILLPAHNNKQHQKPQNMQFIDGPAAKIHVF